eukprot:333565-Prymnesium_polylepis.1
MTRGSHRRQLAPSTASVRSAILSTMPGVPSSAVTLTWTSSTEVTVTIQMAAVSSSTITSSSIANTVTSSTFISDVSSDLGVTVCLAQTPSISVSLVYPPSPPPPTPASPGAVVVTPASTILGPSLTVARTGVSQTVTFSGTNMQDEDDAAWVPWNS